jgi:VIT1/CCC1 family predicted Fe2+/Mn2+ transporter
MQETSSPTATSPPGPAGAGSKRVLDPVDRVTEVLFGLIMVLTFTGTFSAAGADQAEVRELLFGALGCNLAWGLIDGIMYLMGCLSERAGWIRALRAVQDAADPAAAHRVIASNMAPLVASVIQTQDLEHVRQVLDRLPEPPAKVRLAADDWWGALAVFLWVFLCTFPVVLPFVFIESAAVALRTSNAIAVVMLYATGHAYGRCVGLRPLWTGLAMLLLGLVLVAMTIALGG